MILDFERKHFMVLEDINKFANSIGSVYIIDDNRIMAIGKEYSKVSVGYCTGFVNAFDKIRDAYNYVMDCFTNHIDTETQRLVFRYDEVNEMFKAGKTKLNGIKITPTTIETIFNGETFTIAHIMSNTLLDNNYINRNKELGDFDVNILPTTEIDEDSIAKLNKNKKYVNECGGETVLLTKFLIPFIKKSSDITIHTRPFEKETFLMTLVNRVEGKKMYNTTVTTYACVSI